MKLSFLYIFLTTLVVLDAVCYFGYQLSLAGYWTDKILVWLWLAFTIYFIVGNFKRKIIKLYTLLLVVLLVLSVIPFGLLLISFLSFVSASDRTFVKQLSPIIRVQEIIRSPMTPANVEVVQESGLLESVVANLPYQYSIKDTGYFIHDASSIRLKVIAKESVIIQLSFPTGTINEKVKLKGG